MIDLDLPFDLPEEAPDLAFDDGPVDPMIYRGCQGKPTPADLSERWRQGYSLDDAERKVLNRIVWMTKSS